MSPADGSSPITVLVVEDQQNLRETISDLIRSDSSLELVGAAQDVREAAELADKHRPSVALVDVKMPQGGGPQAAREIRRVSPETRMLALSAYDDRATVMMMLRAGASGYLIKSASAQEILAGVRRCAAGESVLSAELTGDVVQELVSSLDRADEMARELADLDRVKGDLIQTLAHELRTPLTVIMGAVPILTKNPGVLPADLLDEMSAAMLRGTSRLYRVARNMEATAQLGLKGMRRQTQPVQVIEIIEEALDEFPVRRGRFALDANLQGSVLSVWADRALAVRAVVTVMENAADFSPPEAEIEVSTNSDKQWTAIMISDRGPGVPKEKESTIFQAFTQVDTSGTRSHQGIGIGLYLAWLIMGAHKGSIRHDSRPDGGSRFVLTFPTAPL